MEYSVQDFGPQHKYVELLEWVQSKATELFIGLEHPSYKKGLVGKSKEQKALERPHRGLPILKRELINSEPLLAIIKSFELKGPLQVI